MNPAIVTVDGNEYSFLQDQVRTDAARLFAITEVRLLDEMTGRPVRSRITISGDRSGLLQRLMDDGFAGLAGIPGDVFHGIDLTVDAQTMTIECAAQGFLVASFDITIGPFADYPESIGTALPVSAGSLSMHHEPVVMEGRVITEHAIPFAGATVELSEFMLNVETPEASFVADTRHPVALKSSCYARRAATDQCRLVTIANGAASPKNLVGNIAAGNIHIAISNVDDLSVGDLLQIDFDGGELSELIEIAEIEEVADLFYINHSNAFADITLAYPLAHNHVSGATVLQRIATTAGPIKTLALDTVRGDATLLLDNVAGWTSDDVIQLSSVSGADEYHLIDFYTTITDAEGYYRLPAMNRLGQLSIEARQGALSSSANRRIPDYNSHNNLIDILMVGP